jgi:hypothetical protein
MERSRLVFGRSSVRISDWKSANLTRGISRLSTVQVKEILGHCLDEFTAAFHFIIRPVILSSSAIVA